MAVKKNTEVENVEVTETVEKEAVNVLDLLLGSDLGTIKQPHKDMEITRLSEALGAPFVVRCEALSPDTYEEVQENAIKINGKDVDLDMNKLQMLTVIEGVKATAVDENGYYNIYSKEPAAKVTIYTSIYILSLLSMRVWQMFF